MRFLIPLSRNSSGGLYAFLIRALSPHPPPPSSGRLGFPGARGRIPLSAVPQILLQRLGHAAHPLQIPNAF